MKYSATARVAGIAAALRYSEIDITLAKKREDIMNISRRNLIKGGVAAGLALTGGSPFAAVAQQAAAKMVVIDSHGHYTTEPKEIGVFREAQIAALRGGGPKPS